MNTIKFENSTIHLDELWKLFVVLLLPVLWCWANNNLKAIREEEKLFDDFLKDYK